jgi:hypothetical protein
VEARRGTGAWTEDVAGGVDIFFSFKNGRTSTMGSTLRIQGVERDKSEIEREV